MYMVTEFLSMEYL